MKRFIAICLLIVCVALPLVSMADVVCNKCHGINAYNDGGKWYKDPKNTVYHTVEYREYTICRDCGYKALYKVGNSYTQKHSLTHYTQQISPYLTYEYDKCSGCGGYYNTHTYYHN